MAEYVWGSGNLRTGDRNKDIDVWFDIDDLDHLKAYAQLESEGSWPEGFPPEGIQFPTGWGTRLRSRLADAYVMYKLGEK